MSWNYLDISVRSQYCRPFTISITDLRSRINIKEITVFLRLEHEGERKINIPVVVLFWKERRRTSFPSFRKDLETAQHPLTSFSAEAESSPRTAGVDLSQMCLMCKVLVFWCFFSFEFCCLNSTIELYTTKMFSGHHDLLPLLQIPILKVIWGQTTYIL